MDYFSAGWGAFVKDGKLHPLLTYGLMKPGHRVYPRTVEELERWEEIKDYIKHPTKWNRNEIQLPNPIVDGSLKPAM